MASGSGGRIVQPPVPMTITQIAVVVADMESALRSYTENLGWGPWSVFDYKPPLLHDTVVRGEQVEYRMIGAETSVDGLGFELIQPDTSLLMASARGTGGVIPRPVPGSG
jgi:methylmalonyl-CoA/ethylmalonyl-CoA epimerase